jgi:hypothetical protein
MILAPSEGRAAGSIVEIRVAASADDAEEGASGSVSLTSSDLELVLDGSMQTVGMRFNGLPIPRGANILAAYVQFQVDEVGSSATNLTIQGQDSDNAANFATATRNVSSRPRTSVAVPWSPVPWNTVGQAGLDQRTPGLAAVIQEIVDRAGWVSGNSLVILITGTGKRTAEAHHAFERRALRTRERHHLQRDRNRPRGREPDGQPRVELEPRRPPGQWRQRHADRPHGGRPHDHRQRDG